MSTTAAPGGLYIAFSVIIIIVLVIDYAAQYRPPDHETPSHVADVERRDEGDDAA